MTEIHHHGFPPGARVRHRSLHGEAIVKKVHRDGTVVKAVLELDPPAMWTFEFPISELEVVSTPQPPDPAKLTCARERLTEAGTLLDRVERLVYIRQSIETHATPNSVSVITPADRPSVLYALNVAIDADRASLKKMGLDL